MALRMTVLSLIGTLPVVAGAQQRPAPQRSLVFDGVIVVDVAQGKLLADQRVVVIGNRVHALGSRSAVPLPPNAQRIDARGKYLIPGLWDLHFHEGVLFTEQGIVTTKEVVRREVNAIYRQLTANGILGIRDAGSAIPLDTFRAWKREIAAGQRVGPRLIVSGPYLGEAQDNICTRTHVSPSCAPFVVYISRPEEAAPLIDSLKAAGADMIKIRSVLRPVWFAAAAEARRIGIPFGGHFDQFERDGLPSTIDGLAASDSGARILDHIPWVNACGWDDPMLSMARCADVAMRFRRNHTWVAGAWSSTGTIDQSFFSDSMKRRVLRYGGVDYAALHGEAWRPPSVAERRQLPSGADLAAAIPDSLRKGANCGRPLSAYAADLPWVPGSDFPAGGGSVTGAHLILLHAVLCGVPPWWALRAATLSAAQALGLDDSLGTVAEGKVADLVLLEGDPLADIWNVTKVAAVIADGHYYDRTALDRLLAEASKEWQWVAAEVVASQSSAKPHP